jgi:ABC-type multidrug transport system ATPase subunit
MYIQLENLGKRFSRQWIFRGISCSFEAGNSYAIVGPNGSGKSTLLQVIAGAVEKSEGAIRFSNSDGLILPEKHFQELSMAAPYLELIEELTLTEFLHFHQGFKPFVKGVTPKFIIEYLGLKAAASKQLRYFSSGMKQRVKLAQAVFSDVSVVILDEPTANLDLDGIDLYLRLVKEYCAGRILLVGSNDEDEIKMCTGRINVNDFKKF